MIGIQRHRVGSHGEIRGFPSVQVTDFLPGQLQPPLQTHAPGPTTGVGWEACLVHDCRCGALVSTAFSTREGTSSTGWGKVSGVGSPEKCTATIAATYQSVARRRCPSRMVRRHSAWACPLLRAPPPSLGPVTGLLWPWRSEPIAAPRPGRPRPRSVSLRHGYPMVPPRSSSIL
jgi:hypothetical protein